MSKLLKQIEEEGKRLSADLSEKSLGLIQRCISLNPVIVLGSGASAAYGFAGMSQLAIHLIQSITPDQEDNEKWNDFKAELESGIDLESALHKVSVSEKLEKQIILRTRDLILRRDIEVFTALLKNEIHLPLGKLLQHVGRTANQTLKVVTTNYDRMAEYAIDQALLKCNTGFSGEYQKSFTGFHRNPTDQVELLKVHGSLDWFLSDDVNVVSIPDIISEQTTLTPLMVTPGARKYEHTHNDPFRSTIARADIAFETASSILCVGYGFNDNHIHSKLNDKLRQGKAPILIATRTLSDSAMKFIKSARVANVIGIEEFNGGTKVVFHDGEEIIEDLSFWSLDELIKLVM